MYLFNVNPLITARKGIFIMSVCIEFRVRKSRKIKPWRILKNKIELSSELYCQTTLAIEYRHRRSFCVKIIEMLFSKKKRKGKELKSLLRTLYVFLCQLYFCKTTRVHCSVNIYMYLQIRQWAVHRFLWSFREKFFLFWFTTLTFKTRSPPVAKRTIRRNFKSLKRNITK